jgi:hypothetical protein
MPMLEFRNSGDDRIGRAAARPKPPVAVAAPRHARPNLKAAASEIIRNLTVLTLLGIGTLALRLLLSSLYGTGH